MMGDELSVAPWTDEEVANLEQWQASWWVHPYTCGSCRDADPTGSDERRLVPTTNGWRCRTCDMRQNWCWAGMVKGPWADPFERH